MVKSSCLWCVAPRGTGLVHAALLSALRFLHARNRLLWCLLDTWTKSLGNSECRKLRVSFIGAYFSFNQV
jgi:hypothetical protein